MKRHLVGRLGQTEAEGAVQEVFIAALTNRQKFDALKGNFAQWLHGIAKNMARVRRRRSQPTSMDEMPDVADIAVEPLDELVEDRLWLEAALATLDESDREILRLRYMDGLSFAEIAQVTGKRKATVQKRAKRAEARLKKYAGVDE